MKLERKMREEKNKRFKKTKFSGCVNDTEKGIGNTEKEFEKEKMREEDEKRTTVNIKRDTNDKNKDIYLNRYDEESELHKKFDDVIDTVIDSSNRYKSDEEKIEGQGIKKSGKPPTARSMFEGSMDLKNEYVLIYTYVAICGALGAMTRYFLSTLLNEVEGFPFGTFVINSIGCFLLATVYNFLGKMWHHNHRIVVGLSMGFIGAFTSFATFSVEVIKFALAYEVVKAVAYWVCGSVSGFTGAVLGIYVTDYFYEKFGGDENDL